jgi:hypothetical protein
MLQAGGNDIKSVKPALDDINLKLSKIYERDKKVVAFETNLVSKIVKLVQQTITYVE